MKAVLIICAYVFGLFATALGLAWWLGKRE